MPKLTIDGKEIEVKPGTTIIQACDALKLDVPRYCYHPGLSVAGNCRICMVEVEGAPKTLIACQTLCHDGMAVKTNTEWVQQVRSHVLEYLLVNHPLDCPVCDQAGECLLQDYYMKHGLYDPKFNENKVKKTQKAFPIGPTIILDQERCILCSRCIRFTDEVTKTHEFGLLNRGDKTEISVAEELKNPYSGNVADICPVGALTDRDFRFKCRVWYLETTASICPGCSKGCNITLEYNLKRTYKAGGARVMRLKPRENPEVNGWWMCDEGRYGYKFIDENRLTSIKGADDWTQAVRIVADRLREITRTSKQALAVLLSPQQCNEELYMAALLFGRLVGRDRLYLVSPNRPGYQDDFLMRADKNPNTAGAHHLGFEPEENILSRLERDVETGTLKGLYIFGQDLVTLYGDEARRLFKKLDCVVYQGSNRNQTDPLCSMVLPSSVYAEQDGTFTNEAGMVQRFHRAFAPPAGVWEGIKIISALAAALAMDVPKGEAEEIFNHLAHHNPAFKGLSYAILAQKKKPQAEEVLV